MEKHRRLLNLSVSSFRVTTGAGGSISVRIDDKFSTTQPFVYEIFVLYSSNTIFKVEVEKKIVSCPKQFDEIRNVDVN